MRRRSPGSSALRASTPGLNSDDPSGASPLRDRHAVAAGLGSVDRIAQLQGLSLLRFEAQIRHPSVQVVCDIHLCGQIHYLCERI